MILTGALEISMSCIPRAILGVSLLVAAAACSPAEGTSPARAPEAPAGAAPCPEGSISDGTRCRTQRGIVIDQIAPPPEPPAAPE
ncbi:MAG: hypothetical protein IT372_40835 [Polyangiaceae bacterium]|nr:hypothetical protein [Polyangiaceae bacterium]